MSLEEKILLTYALQFCLRISLFTTSCWSDIIEAVSNSGLLTLNSFKICPASPTHLHIQTTYYSTACLSILYSFPWIIPSRHKSTIGILTVIRAQSLQPHPWGIKCFRNKGPSSLLKEVLHLRWNFSSPSSVTLFKSIICKERCQRCVICPGWRHLLWGK